MKIVEKYTSEIIEDLFLRACKSRNNLKQVEMLYKRFYYKDIDYKFLASYLINLYNARLTKPLDVFNLLEAVSPCKIELYQNTTSITDKNYYKQIVMVMASKIAIAEIHFIKDYKIPAYWRNYERYESEISTKSN